MKNKKIHVYIITIASIAICCLFAMKILFFRIDLTEEKSFSISKASKNILKSIESPIDINIYIGDADANIAHLKSAIEDMLDEFAAYAKHNISYRYINPSAAKSDEERKKKLL